jgi:predicted transposase/invertase (TIGR01784 family)
MKKKESTKEPIISKHDQEFKDFFNAREVACSFFQEYLPPKIKAKFDFNTLEIVKDTFIDKKLSRFYSDVLYKVQTSGETVYIYLLLDHKSAQEDFMGFQFLKYMVRIWELHFKQNKKVTYLPVIVPMVIYHGASKWEIKKRFISLFKEVDGVNEYIPDFKYLVYDISHIPDEEIKGDVLLQIVLSIFKYILSGKMKEKLPGILELFLELQDKTKAIEYLESFLKYLVSSAKDLDIEYIEETVTRYIEEGGNLMQTIAQQLLEKGKQEGIIQGMQKGMQQGMQKGMQQGMQKGMQQGMQQGMHKGMQQGMHKKEIEIVKKALKAGFSIESIAMLSGLSIDEIRKKQAKMKLK